jgi:hypothetical protein
MATNTQNTTEFKFTIPSTDRFVSLGELENVIKAVHWNLVATHTSGVTAESYGTIPVGAPNPELFTPYEEVTEELAASWVEAALEAAEVEVEEGQPRKSLLTAMKESLEKEIALKVSPEVITEPLPATNKI